MLSSAADALATVSDSTAPVFSLSTAVLPFATMRGVVAYVVAPATSSAALHEGVLVCGEFVVTRVDGEVLKSYSYVYGPGTTGNTVFTGPYKDFPTHRIPSSCSADPSDLLGYNPLLPRRPLLDLSKDGLR
jgi:hypothetical protein